MSILQEKNKELAKIIREGTAFVNPMADAVNDFKVKALAEDPNDLSNKVNDLCDRLGIAQQFSPSDITDIQNKISELSTTLDNFKAHTDQLAGVDLEGNKNLMAILDITKAAQDLVKACSDSQSVEDNPFYKVFGSILKAPQTVQDMTNKKSLMDKIKEEFELDEFFDELNGLLESEKITRIREKIDSYKAIYDNLKGKLDLLKQYDDEGFREAQKEVAIKILAEKMGDYIGEGCSKQVIEKIRSPELAKAIKTLK